MQRVTFILPTAGVSPIGGYKVVYEYASRLTTLGYLVTVVHSARYWTDDNAVEIAKGWLRYLKRRLENSFGPQRWFKLHPEVRLLWVPSLSPSYIPDGDVVIATAWQTAEWVSKYPRSKGRQFHLLYDYEHYKVASSTMRQRIARALALDLEKIVTSPAVAQMLEECSVVHNPRNYLSNGIDLDVYYTEQDLEGRSYIGFPSRREPFKGTKDAIQALSILRTRLMASGIKIWSFGTMKPEGLPDWIEFHTFPSDQKLRQLYNQTSIFIQPSHFEGWGLPGAEAMACGAALISTDNGGVRAYAEHGVTALLCQPQQPSAIAQAVVQLLDDPGQKLKLAQNGNRHIQGFTWDNATQRLTAVISRKLK
ncbi:MAG: glycosyltransferase family 4 protein [Meiothermus sp.]|nr:glycosyltransferase family 4 protein [Meiothermus sp.]